MFHYCSDIYSGGHCEVLLPEFLSTAVFALAFVLAIAAKIYSQRFRYCPIALTFAQAVAVEIHVQGLRAQCLLLQ